MIKGLFDNLRMDFMTEKLSPLVNAKHNLIRSIRLLIFVQIPPLPLYLPGKLFQVTAN